jgi:hypothetical protein
MHVLEQKQGCRGEQLAASQFASCVHVTVDVPPATVTAVPDTLALLNAGQAQSRARHRRTGPARFGSRGPPP